MVAQCFEQAGAFPRDHYSVDSNLTSGTGAGQCYPLCFLSLFNTFRRIINKILEIIITTITIAIETRFLLLEKPNSDFNTTSTEKTQAQTESKPFCHPIFHLYLLKQCILFDLIA